MSGLSIEEKRAILEQVAEQLGKRAENMTASDLKDWLALDNARWEQFMAEIRDLRSGR